jgi:hypothetical protein
VLDPVLLAAGVHRHGRVAELLEPTCDSVGAAARTGAVDDDDGGPVWEERRREPFNLTWGMLIASGRCASA